ncbi:type IV secretion system protein [Rhizobium sp. VS19-DR104.2]|uniref:type IV secretion system protein n=1 Tax=unclassified Rhizobium TaxID=2613769 RepID=UPI001CC62B1E|nr:MULTISPECIES: type IV secretion system protein [unclassified Rhizobium]MBZ5763362.1 type IV secretion system protein [Rhizobium sp. VS19-DR96]MBZ5769268.1 type IV secretion system protein [Rhizobium sp. VS19-DR129.2]MBZ5776814.1 type IV secretion system protein [Rhizobium sp. VS19-DRK62.2]MBZ5787881.1 type IV secretion system protein [Rhizobium sp. VS19-DR121]MBZ5805382.1 type IV secretion system protein [Rhizobium sp. VS19-DR181]
MNPFDILFGKIDSMGVSAVQSMYTTLAGYLGPLFLAGLTVYVVWWGYEMLFGRAQMTAGTFVWRFGRAFICYSLIVSWATYQPLIVKPLLEAPDGMATIVCQSTGGSDCGGDGSSGSSVTQGLTDIWNSGIAVVKTMVDAGGITAVGMYILAIVVLAVVCILCAIAVTLLMIGKMTMFILLAIGPIVLCCALFNLTSRVVDGWIASLAGYALLPIIVYVILGFMLTLLKARVDALTADASAANMTTLAPFMLMSIVTAFLLTHAISIALAIAGGGPRIDALGAAAAATTVRLGWRAAAMSGQGIAQAGGYLFNQRPGAPATIGDGDPAAAQVRAAAVNARK